MTDAAARGTRFDAAVTAIVLTLDEEAHLPDCLRSLRWADRVVVVDSGSRDRTVAIARAAGADVVTHPFVNYARQRQFALGLADTRWVLFVDADERVSEALAVEVRALLDAREQDTAQECSHTLGVAPSAADRANYLAQKGGAATPPPASPTLVPRGRSLANRSRSRWLGSSRLMSRRSLPAVVRPALHPLTSKAIR